MLFNSFRSQKASRLPALPQQTSTTNLKLVGAAGAAMLFNPFRSQKSIAPVGAPTTKLDNKPQACGSGGSRDALQPFRSQKASRLPALPQPGLVGVTFAHPDQANTIMPNNSRFRSARGVAIALLTVIGFSAQAQTVPDNFLNDVQWRLLGPFRAGWSTTTQGIPDQPDTYYFGAAGGGVWKTTDSGQTWHSVFDKVSASSIGALAIAPSNPQVIYVGTGQVEARYDIAAGNGVYKSTDGGATWNSVGLAATRHIGAVLVDPRNADTVLVGALGHYFGPNPERGVYRSGDGGKTWQQTLFVDADTGVVDLAADPSNPDIVYAATWQVRNYPWLSYFQPNAGPGSGLYRSGDGGKSWARITGHGWPTASLGRIGLATAGGGRVYAVINAAPHSGNVPHAASKDEGGLYRSDDGGANWQAVSQEGWLENDYFCRITTDPGNRDRIYSAGQSVRRSDDGGKTWTVFKGAPGGDDYHFLWINPKNPQRMVVASDQGTAVSVNAGRSWSDWYNQPTGQFYHLAADNRFPYWVYSGQQDSGTVGVSSRSDYGALGFRDWHPVGGDERDDDVPDPQDANIVYSSGLGGRLSRWDARTGEVQNVSPWSVSSYGKRPTEFKYRYTWITPIAISQKSPFPLYQGAQVLFRSLDQGHSWQTISPDLSAKSEHPENCKGNLAAAAARSCGYGVIFNIGLSARDNDEIWVGTDDGTIQRTRDAGAHWQNVTPKSVPAWSKVATVDISASTPGSVYAAVDNHRQDDFSPHIVRTRDDGKTWTEITNGLPKSSFVDVVRSDPVKPGLLYAGTDTGVFVSFDDGDHWQSLQRNLPTAWVSDLLVHGDDLIASTQGRAIWVLDNVSPLRQAGLLQSKSSAKDAAVLFQPATAMRLRGSQNKDTPPPADTPLGQNPPNGAAIDYWLPAAAKKVVVEIRDTTGKVVHRAASDEKAHGPAAERYFSEAWTSPPAALAATAGAHRYVWNLRYPRPQAVHYDYSIGGVFGEGTSIAPEGSLVMPGEYDVVLVVDGRELRRKLKVAPDPRMAVNEAAMRDALTFSSEIEKSLLRDYIGYGEMHWVATQIDKAKKSLNAKGSETTALVAIAKFEEASKPLSADDGDASANFDNIGEILSSLQTDIEGSDRAPSQQQHELLTATDARLDRASALWERIKHTELSDLNGRLKDAGLAEIAVPAPDQIRPEQPAESVDLP
jgi:photosystem II stability/assembly factor-like uncharacterized protein